MTLFSESGILSVKTGGQREIAQMEEQEKQRLFEIAGKYEDCVYIEVSSVQSGSTGKKCLCSHDIHVGQGFSGRGCSDL